MRVSPSGAHLVKDNTLTRARWYVGHPLSYRQAAGLMRERGVAVDHSIINRWVVKYSPQLEVAFHRRKRPAWLSWCTEETYIKIKGRWY